MIGHHNDVGILIKIVCLEVLNDLPEIIIGIAHGRSRSRSVDAGPKLVWTIALIMLCAVWVSRPINEQKWFGFFFDRRQDRLRHCVRKILLLEHVGR